MPNVVQGRVRPTDASGFLLLVGCGGKLMSSRTNGWSIECVAVDLNTQRDFCHPGGAYPVANLETFLPALQRTVEWVGRQEVPIVSSFDSHRKWEVDREGIPRHCVDGSEGQRKLEFTLMPPWRMVEGDNTLWAPIDIFTTCRQVIFRKRTRDFFANPKADRFLTQLPALEYVIFGLAIETSVKNVALGLIARHRRVRVVADACGYWNKSEADLALRQIEAKGAQILTSAELVGQSVERRRLTWAEREEAAGLNGRSAAYLHAPVPPTSIPASMNGKRTPGGPGDAAAVRQ